MKRKRMAAAVLAGMLAAQGILSGGCSREQSMDAEKEIAESRADRTEKEITGIENEEGESGSDSALRYTDGVNGFAFRFTKEMIEEKGEAENLIVSPYSVWLSLAALANATDEAGREQLLNALGEAGVDVPALNETVKAMNASLQQEERAGWMKENGLEYECPLKIANALFVGQNSKVKREFEKIFRDDYQGKIFEVDFADASGVEAVNDWVSHKTEGKIREILESFDPQTVAAIANAVFFSDSWVTEFPESKTKEDVFCGAGGRETVPFMNGEFAEVLYREDDEMQAVCLTTGSGGKMIILLPKGGRTAEEILERMDAERFEQIAEAKRSTVRLSLPKFKLESSVFSVKEAMERLNVPLSGGEVPLLSELVEGESLFLSEAVQKAMVEVDENGVTAAAATVMMMARGAMAAANEPVTVKCDRPFAFLLTGYGGEQGEIVLFSGIVNQIGQ